jgi:hypothetical protein
MPRERPTHLNPNNTDRKTRCGVWLRPGNKIKWTLDPADATCNRCVKYHKQDVRPWGNTP